MRNLPALPPLEPEAPAAESRASAAPRPAPTPTGTVRPDKRRTRREGRKETEFRTTFVIDHEVSDILDTTGIKIRTPTGRHLNRSEIVRAMSRALDRARLTYHGVDDEQSLEEYLVQRLSRR